MKHYTRNLFIVDLNVRMLARVAVIRTANEHRGGKVTRKALCGRRWSCLIAVIVGVSLAGCGQSGDGGGSVDSSKSVSATQAHRAGIWVRFPPVNAPLTALATLGKRIFFDPSLSESGKLACASCHDPDHAYAPPNALAVQMGGRDMHQAGLRAVPSLRYMGYTPKYTSHYAVPTPDGIDDEGATGGYPRDGAVDSLHQQALMPLLNPREMANRDVTAIAAKLRKAPYADQLVRMFGADIFERPNDAVAQSALAIEAFETEGANFQPYTSKFDAVMAGNARFSDDEQRGFVLFHDPNKGNCAKCHVDSPGPGGRPAQFTDFGFDAIGVPRNPEIPANLDPRYFDLGLCRSSRPSTMNRHAQCGMFKTPTLRNVASRRAFFHNGRFHTLAEVLHFYVERDSDPSKWYRNGDGKLVPYDDLPAPYRENVDRINAPFRKQSVGQPILNDDEIADLIAFLKTLDDGYSVQAGGARPN